MTPVPIQPMRGLSIVLLPCPNEGDDVCSEYWTRRNCVSCALDLLRGVDILKDLLVPEFLFFGKSSVVPLHHAEV